MRRLQIIKNISIYTWSFLHELNIKLFIVDYYVYYYLAWVGPYFMLTLTFFGVRFKSLTV